MHSGARRRCSRNPESWAAGRWRPRRLGGTAHWADRPGRWRDRFSAAGPRGAPAAGDAAHVEHFGIGRQLVPGKDGEVLLAEAGLVP